ncbi:hypothetical protein [Streptomyces mirabilis]|uniref:hypothetical protein n=1 Tax=Streptomyces mirabilis TaxID=68239 RepID=UPI0036D0963F
MSEDVRWLWLDECGDPWAPDDIDDDWLIHPKVRRYCPECGQVVRVRQVAGEVYVPAHLVTDKDGCMTICEASRTERVLEPAP